MAQEHRKDYPNIRLFQNPILESLSHVHPIIPAVLWVPIVLWNLWEAAVRDMLSWGSLALLFGSGFFVWTFAEYGLHRFIFHWKPKSAWGKRFIYIMHGNHHDVPNDPTRLVMPPFPGLCIAGVFYMSFHLVLGPEWVSAFFAGFMSGYLVYDYTHYAVHHFTPRTAWGRYLKKYHMVHHYAEQEAQWGVSSPLWDTLLRTRDSSKSLSRPQAHA